MFLDSKTVDCFDGALRFDAKPLHWSLVIRHTRIWRIVFSAYSSFCEDSSQIKSSDSFLKLHKLRCKLRCKHKLHTATDAWTPLSPIGESLNVNLRSVWPVYCASLVGMLSGYVKRIISFRKQAHSALLQQNKRMCVHWTVSSTEISDRKIVPSNYLAVLGDSDVLSWNCLFHRLLDSILLL